MAKKQLFKINQMPKYSSAELKDYMNLIKDEIALQKRMFVSKVIRKINKKS